MAIINEEMRAVKGYYCGYCNKFYNPEEVKKTYTVEVVGKKVLAKTCHITCPQGCDKNHAEDWEEFDPEYWSHLAAMIQKKYKDATWFKVPIYDNENDLFPVAYKTVRTVEEVEEIAGRYCVEVIRATIDEFDLVDVEVEFV
jgi:hypothetical protein